MQGTCSGPLEVLKIRGGNMVGIVSPSGLSRVNSAAKTLGWAISPPPYPSFPTALHASPSLYQYSVARAQKKYKWNIGDSTELFFYFFLVKKWTIHHSIYKRVVRGVAFRVMIPKLYRHPKLQLTYSMSLRDILISVWLWNFDNLCKYLICPFL